MSLFSLLAFSFSSLCETGYRLALRTKDTAVCLKALNSLDMALSFDDQVHVPAPKLRKNLSKEKNDTRNPTGTLSMGTPVFQSSNPTASRNFVLSRDHLVKVFRPCTSH